MYQKYLSPALQLVIMTLIFGLFSLNAHADDRHGIHSVENELQAIKDQLTSLQQAVSDLSGYVQSETASTGEAKTEICYNAKLGVLANGSIFVGGVNQVGVGTGLDIYGLLDIDARVHGDGQARLASMIESGVDMTVKMCLNAGVTNVTTAPRKNETIPAPAGLDTLLDSTRTAMNDVYKNLPDLVASLPAGPDNLVSGINVLSNAASGSDDFSTTALLSYSGWNNAVTGLPGEDILRARYDAIDDAFSALNDTDVCGYYQGLGSVLEPTLANYINTVCSAVPPGIDTSVSAISNVIDLSYTNITSSGSSSGEQLNNILGVTNATYNYLTNVTQPTLSSTKTTVEGINGTVNSIKGTVEDIHGALP